MRYYPNLKIKYSFEITRIAGQSVAVCLDDKADAYHGIIKLQSDSAVFIFKRLMTGVPLPILIMDCLSEFPGTGVDEAGRIVNEFLDTLDAQGLIEMDMTHGINDEEAT